MTTFITGASGFLGLALIEHLLSRGDSVVGFDVSPLPEGAMHAFDKLPGVFAMEIGDVRDATVVHGAVERHRPRRLVTLAAVTADARRERLAPASIFEVNVGGVIHAVSAAAEFGVSRVLHASSGSVYGASGDGADPLYEDRTPLRPEGLYGISKQAAEAAALRLAALHRLDLVVARIGTCFGPWEAESGVRDTLSAPLQITRLAERGQPAVLPRDSRRDWLYVRDAAAGLVKLLDRQQLPYTIYNVAAGLMGTIGDWCREVAARHDGFTWRLAGEGESANVDFHAPYDRAPMDIERLVAEVRFAPRYDLAMAAADFFGWRQPHGPVPETARV